MNTIVEEACFRFILVELIEKNKLVEDTMRGIYFNIVGENFGRFTKNKPVSPVIDRDTLIENLRWLIAQKESYHYTEINDEKVDWALEQAKQERMRSLQIDHECACKCDPCDCGFGNY